MNARAGPTGIQRKEPHVSWLAQQRSGSQHAQAVLGAPICIAVHG